MKTNTQEMRAIGLDTGCQVKRTQTLECDCEKKKKNNEGKKKTESKEEQKNPQVNK